MRHVGERHEDTPTTSYGNTNRSCLVATLQQNLFFCRESCPVRTQRVAYERAITPSCYQQVVTVWFCKKIFVVIGLANGNAAPHAGIHGLKQVGSIGCQFWHPSPWPPKVGVRRDMQKASRYEMGRKSFVIIVVAEQIPVSIEYQSTTVSRASSNDLQIGAIRTTTHESTYTSIRNGSTRGL